MNAELCFDLAELFAIEAGLPESVDELPDYMSETARRNHALRCNSANELDAIARYWDERARAAMGPGEQVTVEWSAHVLGYDYHRSVTPEGALASLVNELEQSKKATEADVAAIGEVS